MTLVVARMFSDGPRLIADTQLMREEEARNAYSRGALKVVALHRAVAVAYAGDVEPAKDALLDLGRLSVISADADEVTGQLGRVCRAHPGTDFIVAALSPVPTLRVVTSEGATDQIVAHIGSRPAFEQYQRAFHGEQPPRQSERWRKPIMSPEEIDSSSRMLPSLMQVIEDPSINEVGGIPITLAPTRRGFMYETGAALYADHEQTVSPDDGWVDADWGSAAEGGFGYGLKVPSEAGVGAVGVYFPHGRIGVVYFPTRFRDAAGWTDVGDDEFVAAARDEFGLDLETRSVSFRA